MEVQSTIDKNKYYFSQLDSVRGLSFIAIFLFHTLHLDYTSFYFGDFFKYLYEHLPLGLETFFILSSFLLTFLALNEYRKKGNFSFSNYFIRRFLRIWPLYYFILGLAFILFPWISKLFHSEMSLPNPWYYFLFISNYYTEEHVFFLMFLWTISVEEQFYLIWGISLRFFSKNINVVISILFVFSFSFSVYVIINRLPSYFNTLTYLFDFGCGAFAAILTFDGGKVFKWFQNFSKIKTTIFYFYLPAHFIFFYFLNNHTSGFLNDFSELLGRYLYIIYISLLLIEQVSNKNRSQFFQKNKSLIFTGKISYGLYCYHGIVITFVSLVLKHFSVNLSPLIFVIVIFVINYCVATISYLYFELPILKLKSKWRRI